MASLHEQSNASRVQPRSGLDERRSSARQKLLDSVRRSIPCGTQKADEEIRDALRRFGVEYVTTRHHSDRCLSDDLNVLRDRVRLLEADRKKLIAAGKAAASALDALMGDSDIDGDDSPEFKACQRMNRVLDEVSPKHGAN